MKSKIIPVNKSNVTRSRTKKEFLPIKLRRGENKEIFDKFSQRVLKLDSRFEMHPTAHYIGFKIGNKLVITITNRVSKIVVQLYRVKPEDLNDPEKRTSYRWKSFEYYHKHITQFEINNEDDFDYAMMLVKQVHMTFIKSNNLKF